MQRTGTLATGWIFTIRRRRLFHGRPFSIERMRAIFPGGIEETRDARGSLELAAYAAPPLTLPADLGPWEVEPVDGDRTRKLRGVGDEADRYARIGEAETGERWGNCQEAHWASLLGHGRACPSSPA